MFGNPLETSLKPTFHLAEFCARSNFSAVTHAHYLPNFALCGKKRSAKELNCFQLSCGKMAAARAHARLGEADLAVILRHLAESGGK